MGGPVWRGSVPGGLGCPPAVSLSVTSNQAEAGQVVRLTATVAVPDRGGTIDFVLANGQPIPGCSAVPVNLASTCETSPSPPGRTRSPPDTAATPSTPRLSRHRRCQFRSPPPRGRPPATATSGLRGTLCGPPSIPGPGKAYLGAFVKPSYSTSTYPPGATPTEDELVDLPNLNGALASGGGQPLSLVHVYQEWNYAGPGLSTTGDSGRRGHPPDRLEMRRHGRQCRRWWR